MAALKKEDLIAQPAGGNIYMYASYVAFQQDIQMPMGCCCSRKSPDRHAAQMALD